MLAPTVAVDALVAGDTDARVLVDAVKARALDARIRLTLVDLN